MGVIFQSGRGENPLGNVQNTAEQHSKIKSRGDSGFAVIQAVWEASLMDSPEKEENADSPLQCTAEIPNNNDWKTFGLIALF